MHLPALFAVPLVLSLAAASPVFAGIPLDIAIRTGKVDVTITGRGVSSGDAINLYVQKKAPETIRIDIEPGTVFRSNSGKVQSMVFRRVRFEKLPGGFKKVSEIVLHDGEKRHFILEGYCRDYGKPTPKSSDQFAVEQTNQVEAAIIAQGTEIDVTNKILQLAIWIQRSGEDPAQLRRRFNATSDEFKVAAGLADSAQLRVEQSAAGAIVGTDVEVELKELMAGLRERIQAKRADIEFHRRDRAKAKSGAVLTATRDGRRVIAKLDRATEVEVARVLRDRALCVVQDGDSTRRGWLDTEDLTPITERTNEAPADGLLRESALEALDKLEIQLGNGLRLEVPQSNKRPRPPVSMD